MRREGFPSALTWAVLALVSLLLSARAAQAQRDSSFELTPFFGYAVGSDFEVDDFDLGFVELEVDDSDFFGVMADFSINRNLQIEVFASRQSTDLELAGSLFFPSEPLGEVDIEVLHAGVLYQGSRGQLKPYAVLTGGISSLDTEFGGSETYPSVALGGGVKFEFAENFGFRLDGRFLFTDLDEQRYDCCYDQQNDSLTQLLVSAGLQFRF